METKVLSVRISKELDDEAMELGIDIKGIVKDALDKEVTRIRAKKLAELMKKAVGFIDVTSEDWVKSVRENRDER